MMYYLELPNFPADMLIEQYRRPGSTNIKSGYWNVKIGFFKKQIIDFFVSRNLELKDGEIFKKNLGTTGIIHTDIVRDSVQSAWTRWHCAVNINLDNTNSLMYWFSTTDTEVYPMAEATGLRGIHYGTKNNSNFHDRDEYTVLDSFCINGPTLVRTSVPHMVKNLDNKDRWCLSLRFKENPTFEECAKKLLL